MSTKGKAITKILERIGGGPEGKPHSTKKGRIAAGIRKIKRKFNLKLPRPEGFKPSEAMVKDNGGKATHGYGKAYLKGGRVK